MKIIENIRNFFFKSKPKIVIKKRVEKKFINNGDNMDYDGMGDWGRFPPIHKKKK